MSLSEKYPDFLDCTIGHSTTTTTTTTTTTIFNIQQNQYHQKCLQSTYEWIKCKLRSRTEKRKNIELKGKLTKIVGNDKIGFDNSSMQNAIFSYPFFLKYKPSRNKLYISDQDNHIIRSIRNISTNDNDKNKWNGELEIEVGQPGNQEGYSNGNRNTCKLYYPRGFDWDMNNNMYICNSSCICKVDSKSNQISLVAGHVTDSGYKDGNNDEARFNDLSGILCYKEQNHQSPLVLYVCDENNHCIRMIDVTNGKTTTYAGKGEEDDDVDGTLQSARFYEISDIIKDDENDDILYVSDSGNYKIKMIDMKKGMVTTLVGDKNDTSILCSPHQIETIASFIYVACTGFNDCIVKIDKHSKQVTWIKFSEKQRVLLSIFGITYHELDQCFYISDYYKIYRLE